MRVNLTILMLLAAIVIGCSVPPTVNELQRGVLRDMKPYVLEKKGLKYPEEVNIVFDEFNDAWHAYWGDQTLEMLPEPAKWNAKLHEVWVYQVVPRESVSSKVDVFWIFVDRKTRKILGHLDTK